MYAQIYIRLPNWLNSLIPIPSFESLCKVDEIIDCEVYVPPGGQDYWGDGYIMAAYWKLQDRELTDNELDQISDDFIWDEIEKAVY